MEHPVTEMVTGLDLVREQLRVAAGLQVSVPPDSVHRRGVAIECRINAEDPGRDFAPAPGTVTEFRAPAGHFVRTDSHLYAGYTIPTAYDSLLAKVLARALTELRVEGPGIHTTREFIAEILAHPLFQDGKHTTALVEQLSATHRAAGPDS